MTATEISFSLKSVFRDYKDGITLQGKWQACISGDRIILKNEELEYSCESGVVFTPENDDSAFFILHSVIIGVNFHWQRYEDQVFKGSLKLIREGESITAINVIQVEEYLRSVISSEMSATSSGELLKAHAVISRGWLLSQIEKARKSASAASKYNPDACTENEMIRWYDRKDHANFDVCADDHCQRYQGITRASTPAVTEAVEATLGQVLTYGDAICDTRYYKCCGGVTELFENVWEPVNHPYLARVPDNIKDPQDIIPDLRQESDARKWIASEPDAFCRTSDRNILSQVLNDYDQETHDFYRWTVRYRQNELSELVKRRTGIDFGMIKDLLPLERGASGRIIRLKITGTKKEIIIGKELEIRKALSESHLYSSCFYVEKVNESGIEWFVLHGAGWGHGVGLCQIGAAVMGSKGYNYREILQHYFPGSVLEKKY